MVPLNPNFKIFKKAVIERVKWFGLLFLNMVPLYPQNEINTKNTSESAVIKQISQLTPLVTETKIDMQTKTNMRRVSFFYYW